MFQYEFEKRPASVNSCDSRATMSTDWTRSYISARDGPSPDRGPRRPLPPRPIVCDTIPTKNTVPLKVWIIASASCFAVCAALVLAMVVIIKWGSEDRYAARELYANPPQPIYSDIYLQEVRNEIEETSENPPTIDELENDIPVLEKLARFKNVVANRKKNSPDLSLKPQMHPIHEPINHVERKIEKKDKAKPPDSLKDINKNVKNNDFKVKNGETKPVPDFKPIKSDLNDNNMKIKLPESFLHSLKAEIDYEDYYNDDNLYEDYMQSNSMTNYLMEKIEELHNWVMKDPDFEIVRNTTHRDMQNDFSNILKSLNESLLEGNVSIIMGTLKEMYFGENNTALDDKQSILNNGSDLVSFGILTLDVMLLHNIQVMAWESQETARLKMLKDPDVFAFNALFMDPSKVDVRVNEIINQANENLITASKRRQETIDDFDFGKNLLNNLMDIGMSTARAAINLGRAYKNTKSVLNQLTNKQTDDIRNIEGGTHALNHLQMTFHKDSVANTTDGFYTEIDCVWLLYCRNLIATSKLNPPYGTMARINGVALRMLSGELSADKALNTVVYEVLTGWTELKCNDMFPRCSKVNPAAVVMETILQSNKKTQSKSKG